MTLAVRLSFHSSIAIMSFVKLLVFNVSAKDLVHAIQIFFCYTIAIIYFLIAKT